jgi:DNA-binding winged helix-turn-helix (wHTH) protein/tetratricopeptide (TPR) repeat protein
MSPAIGHENKHLYEFGAFRLDPSERILAHGQERIPLAPKAFDTLVVLVQNSGHLLAKEQLMKLVWPDSFVEENNLTQHISALRRALGEESNGTRYIETVPKLGYRFVAPVRDLAAGAEELTLTRRVKTHIVLREEEHEEVTDSPDVQRAANRESAIVIAPRPRLSRAQAVLAVTLPSLVLAAAGYWYFLGLPRSEPKAPYAPTAKRVSVAVLGMKNLSANAQDEWLSTALAEMLTTELAAGERLRTISSEDVALMKVDLRLPEADTWSKATLTKVQRNLGADVAVSGSYMKLGSGSTAKIRLDLRLQDTAKGETIASVAEVGTLDDLFALVSRCGGELRQKLGTALPSDLEQAALRASLPSNSQTIQLYSEGLTRLRAFDAPAAKELFTKAVSADPQFALAHSALAAAWAALGYDEKAIAEAKQAMDLSGQMSRENRLLIAGRYQEMTHNWDQAVQTYGLLFSWFPDNLDYGLRLASAQTSAGKGVEALASIAKLRQLPLPLNNDPQIDLAEVLAAESLGDFKRERDSAQVAAEKGDLLGEGLLVARAWYKQGWALSRMGEPDQAIAILEKAQRRFAAAGDNQGRASAIRATANVFLGRGEYAKARQTAQEALKIFEQIGDKHGMAFSVNTMAIAHYEQGELEQAKTLYEKYLQIEREVASKINIAGALGNIAEVLEEEGQLAKARKMTEDSVNVFVEVGDQRALASALGNLALILYEEGELPHAQQTYEDALKIAQKIQYQRGMAYDLTGIGQVLAAEGETANARRQEEEALRIREKIGEKHNTAVSQTRLAAIALNEGKPVEAESLTREAVKQFQTEKSATDEAFAQIWLARALQTQGRRSEAKDALARASALSRGSLNRPIRFELQLVSAYSSLPEEGHVPKEALSRAEEPLIKLLAEARNCGYLEYEFRIRLALAELGTRYGSARGGRERAERLAEDAGAKGFHSIARQAMAILAADSTQATKPDSTRP